ncbi:MAG: DNA/RNA nuclease SfsA [Proteobacteria bacterium]|nr:DNA/RNA nuclease SfsA [Pseudomonadota bacterium]MBU1581800.1 DNA/RNA nuclease SfsA [Pseudomonadota bacterium]MBU2454732.1 DNA/RNA nuclease SfsA [Pseudomonadota bacterium]MBU2629295.1 DNA/RNA nuclease SfsA [Pseudomonadota bacterium]
MEKNVTKNGYKMPPLITGTLIQRYKRFLADVKLETGETMTVHCPNSGSMKGCAVPGSQVWLSKSDNLKRKYPYTWELIKGPQTLIGINTQIPNKLVKHAIEKGLIKELSGYEHVRAEVKTSSHTRLDLLLENGAKKKCYVEIKNCTLVEEGTAMFPDAVTIRGQKHLDELEALVSAGHRGVIFFLIQRMDATVFKPADLIDRVYGEKLRKAVKNGVEVVARDTLITTEGIRIGKKVPIDLA